MRELIKILAELPRKPRVVIFGLLGGLIVGFAVYAVLAYLFSLAWNHLLIWLFPSVPVIDFWRSLAIMGVWVLLNLIRN